MSPILADGINIPMVLEGGILVLAPVMLFEILVEAALLSKLWGRPFRQLCRFTFRANCWSLLAGIPVLFLSYWIHDRMVPEDLPGYSVKEPLAFSTVALIYFLATVMVEGATAFRWLRRSETALPANTTWKGVLLANLATYAVLAPLFYYTSHPISPIREFASNAAWSSHPKVKVVFIDGQDGRLKSVCVDGSDRETVVPMKVRDYLVSGDLKTCLFRDSFRNLCLYRRDASQSNLVNLVLGTEERFRMNQVAFSPSGRFVAFASALGKYVEVIDVASGKGVRQSLDAQAIRSGNPSIAWSSERAGLLCVASPPIPRSQSSRTSPSPTTRLPAPTVWLFLCATVTLRAMIQNSLMLKIPTETLRWWTWMLMAGAFSQSIGRMKRKSPSYTCRCQKLAIPCPGFLRTLRFSRVAGNASSRPMAESTFWTSPRNESEWWQAGTLSSS